MGHRSSAEDLQWRSSMANHDDQCWFRLQVEYVTSSSSAFKSLTSIALANVLFFNLGARLARLTSNETYADYASKTWDWLETSELIDKETWAVYDGAQATEGTKNCSNVNQIQWSANSAGLTMGAAFMYNFVSI